MGDMADYYNELGGGYLHIIRRTPKSSVGSCVCRVCDTQGLSWSSYPDGWRLYNPRSGERHQCPPRLEEKNAEKTLQNLTWSENMSKLGQKKS